MKMKLAENIRRFRKERSLTQEQLSEALGVTAGAVYKWEAKLSIPELELIVDEMLAIRAEIEAWRKKAEGREAQAAYSRWLNSEVRWQLNEEE